MEAKQFLKNEAQRELARRELARRSILDFSRYTFPGYAPGWFHRVYCGIIDRFSRGEIRRLIVSVPPQHGKSEISTRRLPAFIFGKNRDERIAIASYNATMSRRFNRDIQKIIDDQQFKNLFQARLKEGNKGVYIRTTEEFEIVGAMGSLKTVGRGGALTGSPVDTLIMDDLYKDYAEGASPIIREGVIDWYSSVARTRLHNHSRQLIVFTRWHEDDLIGHIAKKERVESLTKKSQLEKIRPDVWYAINFPAISTEASMLNEFDERKKPGLALWPERHSIEKLISDMEHDPEKFESLYQGNPEPKQGLLYSGFNIYQDSGIYIGRYNYTDTADTGRDFLCSICYGVRTDGKIEILDIYYSQESNEITEIQVAKMLLENDIQTAYIESNNGGRAFGRNIQRLTENKIYIEPFHQSQNKEARIISNSSNLVKNISFPANWIQRWPVFAKDLLQFKKNFRANLRDDAPDALTGVWEKSGNICGSVIMPKIIEQKELISW